MTSQEPLPLTAESTRVLFGLSANTCAFAGCLRRLIEPSGRFAGVVCFIEAATPDGARHNPAMTDDQRRHHDNLVLLCPPHKSATDHADLYSVASMHALKRQHEEVLLGGPDGPRASVPGSFGALSQALRWRLNAEEMERTVEAYRAIVDELRALPGPARQVLLTVLDQGDVDALRGIRLPTHELRAHSDEPLGLDAELEILKRHGFAQVGDPEDGQPDVFVPDEAGFWNALTAFCQHTGQSLDTFVVKLRFESLD